jgi:hypothetical protein
MDVNGGAASDKGVSVCVCARARMCVGALVVSVQISGLRVVVEKRAGQGHGATHARTHSNSACVRE